jgi:hypothetical protein
VEKPFDFRRHGAVRPAVLLVDDVEEARDGETDPAVDVRDPPPRVLDCSPCVHLTRKLEDCMIKQNRNFSKCQKRYSTSRGIGPMHRNLVVELCCVRSHGRAEAVPHENAGDVEPTIGDARGMGGSTGY